MNDPKVLGTIEAGDAGYQELEALFKQPTVCSPRQVTTRFYDDLAQRYNALALGGFVSVIAPQTKNKRSNVRNVLHNRGVLEGQDYAMAFIRKTPDGHSLPRAEHQLVLKRLSEAEIKLLT